MTGRTAGTRCGVAALAAMLALLGAAAAVAELRVTIEPRVIDVLDSARLTIRSSSAPGAQGGALNLDALDEDFEVLSSRSSSQYRSVGGRVESWVEHQIMLRPRRAGTLTIPPIRIGNEVTDALTLQVRDLAPELRDAIGRLVFFETEVSVDPVYVQAQTVLTRRLYYASNAQIYSDLPGLPDIDGAVVIPLGETVSGAAIRDGQRYGVIEQRFAIFPERSGTLTIPEIAITSSVRLQVEGRTRRSGVRVATDPVTIDVLPIPAEYPTDAAWLPAEQVSVSDEWVPEADTLRVGEPVRRTVEVSVEGNASAVVAPLAAALPDAHFRSYPEPPGRSDDASGRTLRGTRSETYALIPTAPGRLELPPLAVTWWDVGAERVRTARAPGRTLTISGTALAGGDHAAGAAADAASPVLDAASETGADIPVGAAAPGRTGLWLALIVILALGVIGWLGRRYLAAARRRGRIRLGPMRPSPAHQALAAACRSGDTAAMHRALLAALAEHFGCSAPEAVRRFHAAGHGELMDRLTAALYGRDPGAAPVQGDAVLRAMRELQRRRREPPPALPALYD